VQNANGETLRELGWRRPTTRRAVLAGVLLGLVWTELTYARSGSILAVPWERPIMVVIGVWLAFGEELAMRGYLIEQLHRGGVAPWLQVVVSALATGCYHGVVGFHYAVLYAATSSVLFGLIAVLYIWGRRSLTPGWIAHSLSHVLGDPTLTMGILLGVLAATPG